ncbi:SDR family oxidoreductase, partial [bacterium]|nr:SDR family oxidoreductase [bacterium]
MLEDKRIIVTGSARGMGLATLTAFVQAGARVVGMDINDADGEQAARDANALGPGKATYLHIDIADKSSVETAFQEAVNWLGGLDVLAHPAAIQAGSAASDVSVEHWDQMFAVNVRGTMITNQAAYHHMKAAGGGSIINFGSISGQRAE